MDIFAGDDTMRGKRAKQIRRSIYGSGMPRDHVYEEINKRLRKFVDKDGKERYPRMVTSTKVLTSLRRAYQIAKRNYNS